MDDHEKDQGKRSVPGAGNLGNVQIGSIHLSFRKDDTGGTHYFGRTHAEEYSSRFYPLLRQALDPSLCIDVGANYGFTGLLMRRAFPHARLVLVEPIPWLEYFVRENFRKNDMQFDEFHSAIVSNGNEGNLTTFGVNDRASQDSRVIAKPGWTVIETTTTSLSRLANSAAKTQGVYIKIDTQGWEQRVFEGGESFLADHDRWFIKTEFAPMWLESQQTDPVGLLRELLRRYTVFEAPGRIAWTCSDLAEAMGRALQAGCEKQFTEYVRNLARNDTGWVDLYVLPPATRRGYSLHLGDSPRTA